MNDDKILKIINENQGLIHSIINKYTNYYDMEDLYQVSVIGIIKAYNNYKPDSETKFTTYAYKWILSEVISFVNNSKTIKTSRKYNTLYKRILDAKNILTQRLMKEPSIYELSLFLEIDESIINDILLLKTNAQSLDATISEDGKVLTLLDSIKDTNTTNLIEELVLKEELNNLSEEELNLIKLRYFQEKTQTEVARFLHTNQVQVSRNEQKILKKLKKAVCNPL